MAAKDFIYTALGFLLLVFCVFLLIGPASYIVGQITGLEPLKGGPIAIFGLVVIIGIMVTFIVIQWGQPSQKWNFLYVLMLLGAVFLSIYQLPKWIPSFFSTVGTASPTFFNMSLSVSGILGLALLGLIIWKSRKR